MRQLLWILVWFAQLLTAAAQPAPVPRTAGLLRQVRVLAGGHGNRADGPGSRARFYWPTDVALGPNGALYVADSENHCIRLISPTGQVRTVAGGAGEGYADGPARTARFRRPTGIVVDAAGVVYVADTRNFCIRRLTPDGQVSTVAGIPEEGQADGQGGDARFAGPAGLAIDTAGTLYVADTPNRRVCTISPAGQVRTLARRLYKYDDAKSAVDLETPVDVAVDHRGTVYVADWGSPCLLRISPAGQVLTLTGNVAGADTPGPAQPPAFYHPNGIAVGRDGTVYATNEGTGQILRTTPKGRVQVVAGAREASYTIPAPPVADGAAATAHFRAPTGLALAPDGTLYVADAGNHRIRRVGPEGQVSTVAGTGEATLVNGHGLMARFNMPQGIAVAVDGTAYIADTNNHCIRLVTPAGRVRTLAGTGCPGFVNGAATVARFRSPVGIAVDRRGVVYVADRDNHCIRRIGLDGRVTTLAGTGRPGFANGAGRVARFHRPWGVAVAPDGTVYVADCDNDRVRRIQPGGRVSTWVGPRSATGREDGQAGIGSPFAVALAANGTLYIGSASILYAVTPGGRVRVLAGGGDSRWPKDGVGASATFSDIAGLTVDGRGRVYAAESSMQQIRCITPKGVVTTVTRSFLAHYEAAPDQPPMELDGPTGLAMGPGGVLYVTNWGNNCILVLK